MTFVFRLQASKIHWSSSNSSLLLNGSVIDTRSSMRLTSCGVSERRSQYPANWLKIKSSADMGKGGREIAWQAKKMSAGGYSKYRYRKELAPNFVNFTIYTETMYGPLLNTCARIEVNNISEYCEPNVMDIRHCAKIYLKEGRTEGERGYYVDSKGGR